MKSKEPVGMTVVVESYGSGRNMIYQPVNLPPGEYDLIERSAYERVIHEKNVALAQASDLRVDYAEAIKERDEIAEYREGVVQLLDAERAKSAKLAESIKAALNQDGRMDIKIARHLEKAFCDSSVESSSTSHTEPKQDPIIESDE